MSSTAIVRALLASAPAITALVPNARIIAGLVEQGTALPAIGVREISSTEDITTARNLEKALIRARVQVTVYSKNYPQMKELMRLTKMGRGVHTGTVSYGGKSWVVRSILQWGGGPEIDPGDDKIYEQSRDFMVTFVEAN